MGLGKSSPSAPKPKDPAQHVPRPMYEEPSNNNSGYRPPSQAWFDNAVQQIGYGQSWDRGGPTPYNHPTPPGQGKGMDKGGSGSGKGVQQPRQPYQPQQQQPPQYQQQGKGMPREQMAQRQQNLSAQAGTLGQQTSPLSAQLGASGAARNAVQGVQYGATTPGIPVSVAPTPAKTTGAFYGR